MAGIHRDDGCASRDVGEQPIEGFGNEFMGVSSSNMEEVIHEADRHHVVTPAIPSFASLLHKESNGNKVHFRTLVSEITDGADVLIPLSSVVEVEARFANTLYGYFLGTKVPFPIVKRYILNAWKKYGITRIMGFKNGFCFVQFSSSTGLERVLEHGHWLVRNVPFILRKWTSSSKLVKEDVTNVPVWIKFHGVPASAFTADGLSVIATHLGTPIMLDSCTSSTCLQSWGRMDFARALIDLKADRVLKDTLVISVPKCVGDGGTLHTIKVEYEWKPPKCNTCMVFGHEDVQCPLKLVMIDVWKPEGTSNDMQCPLKRVTVDGRKPERTSNDDFQTVRRKGSPHPVGSNKETIGNHNVPKQHEPKYVYQKKKKKTTCTTVSNPFSALDEDYEKSMDDLVDVTTKDMEAPTKKNPRKTGIWSDMKAVSPGKSVAFSPETQVYCNEMDDMDFGSGDDNAKRNRDDEGHAGPDSPTLISSKHTIVDVERVFQVSLKTVDEFVAFSKDKKKSDEISLLPSETLTAISHIMENHYQKLRKEEEHKNSYGGNG